MAYTLDQKATIIFGDILHLIDAEEALDEAEKFTDKEIDLLTETEKKEITHEDVINEAAKLGILVDVEGVLVPIKIYTKYAQ